jgi:hypothetical protein
MKLTTHLHLVPRSTVLGAIPPLPSMPSWHGAQVKKSQGQLYLYLLINNSIVYFSAVEILVH